ncbi:ATP-dependent DNA ligase [Streptomyces sp. Ru73]|uniref:non-homologous end-joining DNA ligase n=1 Tax=Streptomyces sp. Ru73 TaxID=2080748 RepID=UPI000CDE306E|nr:non-homologous end-joining DNA ligase [Streptomyces sp. Ru73]POX36358.1 ATP-dependent DNA ligase [Streptomyces sp. Ru73]
MPITEIEGRRLTVTRLDKVLYPATGTTKGEVLHYYALTAGAMLAHLHDRPVSFLRYPDGPDGETFFTKNVPPGTPAWVKTVDLTRRSGKTGRQVVLQDTASLMWAANLVVELHVPQWRIDDPGIADRMVWDLDPGAPATIVDCCAVAGWLHERLSADGLNVYAKTSGSKGLHLLVPIEPTPSDDVSAYAKDIAVEAEHELPGQVVHRMTKALRPGKVFLDFSQNSAAKTTAAPYTVRARSEPTVSTPVTWDEIADCTDPADLHFLIGDIAERRERYGDLLGPLINLNRAKRLPRAKRRR